MINLKRYNWTELIASEDRIAMQTDIDSLIQQGKVFTNSPKWQTNVNILGESGAHWSKLKMSFIWSCFAYIGSEVSIKGIQSWSYRTSLENAEDRDNLWHHHHHTQGVQSLSGVYYVHTPVADLDCGTEFAPYGLSETARHMEFPAIGSWIIYPSATWHRPGVLKSKDNRYIVAADLAY